MIVPVSSTGGEPVADLRMNILLCARSLDVRREALFVFLTRRERDGQA